MDDENKVVIKGTVPETVLRRRKKRAEGRAKQDTEVIQRGKAKKKDATIVSFTRAETLVKQFRQDQRDTKRFNRTVKEVNMYNKPSSGKILFAIRLQSLTKISAKSQKVLKVLRLRMIGTGVFLQDTEKISKLLRLVEPFITWGEVSAEQISDLIHKRGFAKVDKNRLPLTNNKLIADNLGEKDIICLEDIVHEISSGGENFVDACKFLWPFKLHIPSGRYKKKAAHFSAGGEYGYRGAEINQLITEMM